MQLHIRWGTGHMTINCEEFFPASQNKLNVLMKTISLDWQDRDDIIKQMLDYLKNLEADAEAKKQKIKLSFGNEYQKMKDTEAVIQSCKHPNGLPVTKVEMKQLKADLKHQKVVVHSLEQDFKRYSKTAQKSRVNQEIIIRKGGVE